MRASILSLSAMAFTLAACSDAPVAAESIPDPSFATITSATQRNAAVHWNDIARQVVATTRTSAPLAIRGYAVMSVAQHNAAAAAQDGQVHAAISAASVVALSYLFPTLQDSLEALLSSYLADPAWTAEKGYDAAGGEAIGRTVGAQVTAYAQTDGFLTPWTGTVPVGPGLWFSASPPVGAGFGQAKTYLLASSDQFRPPPHPAFGSPEFAAALAEVRQFSDTRTPQQDSIAKFWDLPAGTYTPPGYWNEEAARLVQKYRFNERKAAHLFAIINMVSFDAIVASHEAKFTYWLLRPTMADPAITLSIPLPNFPSYPSNHATISAGMALVIGAHFPAERSRLNGLANQAALSRVYGGIHYRFDGTAGLTLGRKIGEWALRNDVSLRQPFPLD
jgi:hypothetical protein